MHKLLYFLFFFLIFNSSVNGQNNYNNKSHAKQKMSVMTIGYGIFSSPKYEGGSKYTIRAAPFFNLKYRNITVNPISGVRMEFSGGENWSGGIGLGGSFGRYTKQDTNLSGLGNIDWTVEAILFAKYRARFYSINSEIYSDILQNGHRGYYLKTSIGTAFPLFNMTTFIRPSLSITFADKNYLNSFFGVNPKQSMSSGYSEYFLNQGIKDASANLLMIYRLNDKVSLNGTLNYKMQMGAVTSSPIVKSKDQFSGGFSLTYLY